MRRQLHDKKGKNKDNKKNNKKNILVILAILNLVFLFVFDYKIPGLSDVFVKVKEEKNGQQTENNGESKQISGKLTISFDQETLNYNGEGELDLLSDVFIKDEAGNIYSNDDLTVEISGENKKEKSVRYIYSDQSGNTAEAERVLQLSDYEGPSIELKDDMPPLGDEEIEDLKNAYNGYYTAKDGFGQDITDSVIITADAGEKGDGLFDLYFQVKNRYGDTKEETEKVDVQITKPHLCLREKEIFLRQGEEFKPEEYILYAVDANGANVVENVDCDNKVDMNTPGDYTVSYSLVNEEENTTIKKKLTIHVS